MLAPTLCHICSGQMFILFLSLNRCYILYTLSCETKFKENYCMMVRLAQFAGSGGMYVLTKSKYQAHYDLINYIVTFLLTKC